MGSEKTVLRLAIVNDYEIVVAGLAQMLEPFDRIEVVEVAAGDDAGRRADLVLFDTFAQPVHDGIEPGDVSSDGTPIVVYTWDARPQVQRAALAWGAVACIAKTMPAEPLVQALVSVHRGVERGVLTAPPGRPGRPGRSWPRRWPGGDAGLTERESEVIALIASGHSNLEIAEMLGLSMNSIKTYIRTAYRKAGVTRRSQAVIWAVEHGFEPHRPRRVE